jgi:acetyl esterase/lipase
MTIGAWFLLAALVGALNTANAWHPATRRGALSTLSLAAGNLTSTLPLQAIAWQFLATLGFIAAGALDSPLGVSALVITLCSWGALGALHRDGNRDALILAEATPGIATRPLAWRHVAVPSRGERARYCTSRDLAYGDAGVRHQLDVWRDPSGSTSAPAPVLLQIHGGALTRGQKEADARPLLTHLTKQGWVCVAMNYRLSPRATWPEHIADVKRAIAWIRENIADHGGDPSFVAATGGSAGGYLAALAGLTAGDPDFQPGFETADTTVQAVVPMYGLFDLTNRSGGTRPDTIEYLAKKVFKSHPSSDLARWEDASPLCRIRRDAPPFFVVHGRNDSYLPVEQARTFVDELRRVSASRVAYAELPRAQHSFDYFSCARVHHTVRAIERFLTDTRSRASIS